MKYITILLPLSGIYKCFGYDDNDFITWIVKTVCDGATGIVHVDPYYGCPNGTIARKYEVGDPIVYNNYEQMGYQISDSFALYNSEGGINYIHTFDYFPFNEFNQHSGSDGYDIYFVDDNIVSYSNTKDGGGYSSTFYGSDCTVGQGWVLFPVDNFLTPSEDYWPIAGVYWEQDGENYPGQCPSGYSTDTLTVWTLESDFQFGGINGNAVKYMDALISYHGFETNDGIHPTTNFIEHGHLEVFYFTKEYGITRWEVWSPAVTHTIMTPPPHHPHHPVSSQLAECSGSNTAVFKGMNFTIVNCHDWSNVQVLQSPILPKWPLVTANLLSHFHFDSGLVDAWQETTAVGYWHRFGTSSDGNLINWSIMVSTSGSDDANGSGLKYLAMNCGATNSDAKCGSPGSQAIYQDIDMKDICESCTYLYGVNARTTSGAGSLSLALQLLSIEGAVVWQDVFTDHLTSDNGDGREGEAQSIYLSSKFISKTVTLPNNFVELQPMYLRFLIIPVDTNTFCVVDAFVNRFPSLSI